MLWIYFGLVLSLFGAWAGTASTSKREAEYTLDDSLWNEESPVGEYRDGTNSRNEPGIGDSGSRRWLSQQGEVERLLREYRQNQELVRNIGAHYYQIIYPVQLRHHEKMGISTREVGMGKYPNRGYGDGAYGSPTRGRTRTGKHFHRTSLLIKAFNHKFRLDLELNTQLLAPNLMQKHFLPSGAEQVSKQDIEHCYYHGTVKDYPGATAAFHTCNGVSGVIHVGNETFVIHPFYGGDLSKHPHVIFEARTKTHKGCANSGNLEWRMKSYRRTKHEAPPFFSPPAAKADYGNLLGPSTPRVKRDVREATKYIETALVLDKAMFEKRNGSTRLEVVHDAIQVANIADLYFRTLNTRVSVVYIETWMSANQASIEKSQDISRALLNFNDYTSRKLFKVDKDTTQLLTGETFAGGESGMAVPETVCTAKSVGISVDINTYEPHLLAGTMAHMIGHNIGMGHDDGREECFCRDWHGCIMAQSIVGLENVQPYKFSECSRADYIDALRIGHGICLLNKPNEVPVQRTCGNSIVEDGEECDCGTIHECPEVDPCCDPITCKLNKEAQCASGPCCDNCQLRARGVVCRDAVNECDLPEHCNGENGQCPQDVFKKNGNPCGTNTGYCFNGVCPTLNIQCEQIWGYGGVAGDKQCYDQFNSKGSINGHCGTDSGGQYKKCDPENVRCGSLQCQLGNRYPIVAGMDQLYSRTIISIKGVEYECKATSGTIDSSEIPDMGLVRDGTPCGDNLICVNQTCTSIFPHIDQGKCPSNHNNHECSGHGVCTNVNKCYCEIGWSGSDCSIQFEVTTPVTTATITQVDNSKKSDIESKMEKKETPYENYHSTNTVFLVGMLMSVVGGVFIVFALMALCYRRKSTMPKYDPPYVKKPMVKKFSGKGPPSHNPEEAAMESVNKILTFGSMPSYSRPDVQTRVLYRPSNHSHMTAGVSSRLQEHKLQQLKRHGGGSGSEEEAGHSGEEETVSFIDLPPNNLPKLPEKGILKKPGPYGTVEAKEKWSEDSQSDNQEVMSQSDNNLESDGGGGGPITEVERTLKSLNGYHEDILEALRNAASHRSGGPSGSAMSVLGEELRKSLCDIGAGGMGVAGSGSAVIPGCYSDYGAEFPPLLKSSDERLGGRGGVDMGAAALAAAEEEAVQAGVMTGAGTAGVGVPPCGPIRIRNLEDLIRQLEHHSPSSTAAARRMSPSGSEDIRMSETEADRHYRLDSSSGCPDSQSTCRRGEEDPRFVYGRYRHPASAAPPPPDGGGPTVGGGGAGSLRRGTGGHHVSNSAYHHHHRPHHHRRHDDANEDEEEEEEEDEEEEEEEEEEIYETADHDRGGALSLATPDSESDEFLQAQLLIRSASEEALPVTTRDYPYDRAAAAAAVTPSSPPTSSSSSSSARHPRHLHHTRRPDVGASILVDTSAPTESEASSAMTNRQQPPILGEYFPSPPSEESLPESFEGGVGNDGVPHGSVSLPTHPSEPSPGPSTASGSTSVSSYPSRRRSASEDSRDSSRDGVEDPLLVCPARYPEYKH